MEIFEVIFFFFDYNKRMLKSAFTMIELLVVLLIISILTVFGIFTYKNFLSSAKDTACVNKHNFVTKLN